MDDASNARQLLGGPITDSGQLLLALVINELAGPDGWALAYRKDLQAATRTKCRKASARRIQAMVKMGYLEEQKTPVPGLRLTAKALGDHGAKCPVNGALSPVNGALNPIAPMGQNAPSRGSETPSRGFKAPPANASAYLPKRSKDLKEEEVEITASPSSSPPGELVLVADNPTPDTPRLDQPAAQPPAVVEQGDLLPVPAKRKAAPPKRKTPRKKPKARITEDWQPQEKTLANLEAREGIPRAFSEACVWEFITHWMGDGEARPGWDSTFIKSVRYSWKKERENEQTAEQRQRYTDASGRRISESTRVMQDCHDNVLANPHAFVDIDSDKPF